MDPEYAATYTPTERSDVYAFGVVLLELATGWRPIGGPDKKHIIQRVRPLHAPHCTVTVAPFEDDTLLLAVQDFSTACLCRQSVLLPWYWGICKQSAAEP